MDYGQCRNSETTGIIVHFIPRTHNTLHQTKRTADASNSYEVYLYTLIQHIMENSRNIVTQYPTPKHIKSQNRTEEKLAVSFSIERITLLVNTE